MLYNEEKVKATSLQVLEAGTGQSSSTPSHHICQHLLQADVKQCISYCAAADMQWQLLPVTAAAREGWLNDSFRNTSTRRIDNYIFV